MTGAAPVATELPEAAGFAETEAGGAAETDVPFIDQVHEGEAGAPVALHDVDHEPQVRANEGVEGFLIVLFDPLGEEDFLLARDEREGADVP